MLEKLELVLGEMVDWSPKYDLGVIVHLAGVELNVPPVRGYEGLAGIGYAQNNGGSFSEGI